MFEIGDKVVHPSHGAGVIINIEGKEFLEERGRYYVIDLLTCEGVVMVPVASAQRIGLRPVSDADEISRAMSILTSSPDNLPNDHRERRAQIEEKLRTGDIVEVTKVVRNLAWRDRCRKLTMADRRLYERAQTFLAAELALAKGMELQEALKWLRTALNGGQRPPPD